jgi:hypothetical protein
MRKNSIKGSLANRETESKVIRRRMMNDDERER